MSKRSQETTNALRTIVSTWAADPQGDECWMFFRTTVIIPLLGIRATTRSEVAEMLVNARSRVVLLKMVGVTLGSDKHAQGLGVQARPRIGVDHDGREEGKGDDEYHLNRG